MPDTIHTDTSTPDADGCSAWDPGVTSGVPREFRSLETIFRRESVLTDIDQVWEFARWTGLPHEELSAFRPQRLALHELIIRVTADIAVAEGEEEIVFGQNFRRITATIHDRYIMPQMARIEAVFADLCQRADATVHQILGQTLFPTAEPPRPRRFPFSLFGRRASTASPSKPRQELEYEIVSGYKTAGLAESDPLLRDAFKSLYRVLGAILATRGSLGSDQALLAGLVSRHICNGYGSQLIGQTIAPLVDAAIEREGYARVARRASPVLISLKGASAAGKSSLRPMLKQLMSDQGIEPNGYVTISPDIWRRVLLDYEALGPARKYAGHLTSREVAIIDGKLDRYIRYKANRDQGIPHMLVDRFRFDSFSSEKVGRVLHDTYARYVDTMYLYFIVTPPEETVERGWQRGQERGRYKAVEDFLGHCVEAYTGTPKLLFKWLANPRPEFRYVFLDNRVPKGTFPKTIAFGDRRELTIHDPAGFINIERYQKIDVNARSREAVHPPAAQLAVSRNVGFLKECIRRIKVVSFVDPASGTAYLRSQAGRFQVLDRTTLQRAQEQGENAAILAELVDLSAVDDNRDGGH